MPLEYSPFVNPYGASLADTISRSGDAAAHAAEIIAQAQARAQQIKGATWAVAIQNVANLPLQIEQSRGAAVDRKLKQQELEMRSGQVVQQQRAVKGQQLLGQFINDETQVDPDTGIRNINHQNVSSKLAAAGYPDAAEGWIKTATANAENLDKLKALKRQTADAIRVAVGHAANNADNAGDFQTSLGQLHLEDPDTFDQATVQHLLQQAQTGDWSTTKKTLVARGDAAAKPLTQKEGERLVGGVSRTPLVPDLPKPPTEGELDAAQEARLVKQDNGTATPADLTAIRAYNSRKTPNVAGAPAPVAPADFPRYQAQIDAIVPVSDTKNAALRAATIARVQNARSTVDAQKAIEDAQSQIGQINVARNTVPFKIAVTAGAQKSNLAPATVDKLAEQFAVSGKMPAFGQRAREDYEAIVNRAVELFPDLDLAGNQASFAANKKSLGNLIPTRDTLAAFENTAGKNLDQFLSLAAKIPDTGVPWLNTPVRMLDEKVVGRANMAAINAARDVALREIARVTNDPKLSGALTDSARQEVAALSPKDATLPQIKAVAQVLKKDMANVHGSLDQQIGEVQGRFPALRRGADPAAVRPPQTAGPRLGERRMINGQLAEWKTIGGQSGWAPVQR